MAEHDESSYIVVEERGGSFMPFLWGALIGAAAMLLFAPGPGEETRRRLKESGKRLRDQMGERFGDLESSLREQVDDVREQVDGQVSAARGAFEAGVSTGRRAVRETRSDVERRVRETRDAVRSGYESRRPPRPDEPAETESQSE